MSINKSNPATIVKKSLAISAIALLSLTSISTAIAAPATSLGTFKLWTAWKNNDANGVICYVSSQPQNSMPANVNRDPIHFMVIHRKGLGTKNEVQTLVGYPLDTNASISVNVDGKNYAMVGEGSAAWLASAKDEAAFVDGMKRGSEMIVKGKSKRGTNTTDTYSLSGVTAAIAQIDKACK